jgi:hypothetical protein
MPPRPTASATTFIAPRMSAALLIGGRESSTERSRRCCFLQRNISHRSTSIGHLDARRRMPSGDGYHVIMAILLLLHEPPKDEPAQQHDAANGFSNRSDGRPVSGVQPNSFRRRCRVAERISTVAGRTCFLPEKIVIMANYGRVLRCKKKNLAARETLISIPETVPNSSTGGALLEIWQRWRVRRRRP